MIAILGPGGVGGLLAALLERAEPGSVLLVAREETAAVLAARGLHVRSVTFGEFEARPAVLSRLELPVGALIVATKAGGLDAALERVATEPELVVPLLNGLDHVAQLRARFGARALAASIRVESTRVAPGEIEHGSRFLRIELARADPAREPAIADFAARLRAAGVDVAVRDGEADVLWSKLVRLNALACTTSASGLRLGAIRDDPVWRARLEAAVGEAAAVARAEGAAVAPERVLGELEDAHATLTSSMARDLEAGREPELDAIAGAVLRAAARHGISCPAIEEMVGQIRARVV